MSSARIRRKLIEYSAQGSLKKIKALLKGSAGRSSASDASEPSDSDSSGRWDSSSSDAASSESDERKKDQRDRKRRKEEGSLNRGRSRRRSHSDDCDSIERDNSTSGSRSSSFSKRKRRRKGDGKIRGERRSKRRKRRDRSSDSDSDSDSNSESSSDSSVHPESELSSDSDSSETERRAAARRTRRRKEKEEGGEEDEEQGKKSHNKKGRSSSPRYEHNGKRRDKREGRGYEKREKRDKQEEREDKRSRRKDKHRKSKTSHSSHRKQREKRSSSKKLRVDLSSTDAQGWTPLHHAAHSGSADLVKYLLKLAKNKEVCHPDKKSSRHSKRSSKDQKEGFNLVSVQDNRGNTPVHVAARMGHASVIQLLRGAGADMQARNLAGETPEALVQRRLMDLRRRTAEAALEKAGSLWGEGSDNEGCFGGGGGGGGGYGNGSNNPALWGDPEENAEAAAAEARYHRFGSQSDRFGAGPWGADDAWKDDVAAQMKNRMRRDEESHRAAVFGAKQEEKEDKRRRWEEERKVREEEARKVLEAEQAKDKAWRAAIKEQVQKKKVVQKQEDYDERWKRFAKSCDMGITMADVPFPVVGGGEEELKHVILHGVPKEQHRKRMREEVVRWHPDKFMQKWGLRLHDKHRSSIEKRVKELSQAVNNIYASLK